MSGGEILGPRVAGSWYEADPDRLRGQLDEFLRPEDDTPDESGGRILALIVPHAGYTWSGAVAGRGFRHLRGRACDRVLLIGPSHHAGFPGAALPGASAYRTPLGDVPIDAESVERAGRIPGIRIEDAPFRPEHCLEMEIPFLQHTLRPGWRLLPVLIGGGSGSEDCARVADALRPLVGPETLIVVSSDFTHYGPQFGYVPFRESVPERIRDLDQGAVDRILASDPAGFDTYVARTGATICGRRPIGVLFGLLPPRAEARLVAYDTSGQMSGDWHHSVSYASVLFREVAA